MKISPSLTALLDPARKESASLLERLRPGQPLRASVISVPRAGVAQLQIGLTALLAKTRIPLQPGTELRLAVTKLHPVPELRVLLPPVEISPRQQLLKSALPRQLPPAETLQGLAKLDSAEGLTMASPLRKTVQNLISRLTPLQQLSAQQIRTQLGASGLFLEHALASNSVPPNSDLKLDWLRLLRLVQPRANLQATAHVDGTSGERGVPPAPAGETDKGFLEQLLRLAEGGLARVQTQQAASLPSDQAQRQIWQFDLPLLVGNSAEQVQLRIEHDERRDPGTEPAQAAWSVMLRFDFASTGTIQCRITLNGEQVSSTFWCEREHTERAVGRALPVLSDALESTGLDIGRLTSVHGKPPEPVELPRPEDYLLDTRA